MNVSKPPKCQTLIGRLALVCGFLVASLNLIGTSVVAQENPRELFAQGNLQYDSSHYIEAIAAYNQIIFLGQESPELYHNLGNAYFESGDLGHAILNYLRAERLDPYDDDIADNLAFARGFVSLQLEGVELNPAIEFFDGVAGGASLNFWAWLTTGVMFLLVCLLIYRIITRQRTIALQAGTVAIIIVFVALASLTTFKYRHEFAADRAVVTLPDIPVTDRPSRDAAVEFRAAAGLEVVIRERSGDFVLALFANKRQGWVLQNALERL